MESNIAYYFKQAIESGKDAMSTSDIEHFDSMNIPCISIDKYIIRIRKYADTSDTAFIAGLILIDRLCSKNNLIISERNFHRLFLSSIVIGAKGYDDIFYTNKFYSALGGISVVELNYLEIVFLQLIDWSIQISPEVYYNYLGLFTAPIANTATPLSLPLIKIKTKMKKRKSKSY